MDIVGNPHHGTAAALVVLHNRTLSVAAGRMGGVSDDVAIGGLDTPVGRLSVAVTGQGLAAVGWGTRPSWGAAPGEGARSGGGAASGTGARLGAGRVPVVDDTARVAPVLTQLAEYFAGQRRHFDVPIDWRHVPGTASAVVLRTLHQTVGYGSSITYGGLAERSGTGVPARAVGGIMGANPIPVVVPCHRVLAGDGLGGYSGGSGGNGLEVKRWLLTLEGVLPPTFDWSPAGLTA